MAYKIAGAPKFVGLRLKPFQPNGKSSPGDSGRC